MKKMTIVCAAAFAALAAIAEPAADCGCAQAKQAKTCACGEQCASEMPQGECAASKCGCKKGECKGECKKCECKGEKGACKKGECKGEKGACKKGERKGEKGKCRPRPVTLRLTAETSPDEIEVFKRQVLEKIDSAVECSREGDGEAKPPVMVTLIVNDRPGKGPRADVDRPGKGPRADGDRPGKGKGRRRPPRREGVEAVSAEQPASEKAED